MLRIFTRRSLDVRYFTDDPALELDGLRPHGPGWWLRGAGDTTDPTCVGAVLTSSERASVVGYDVVVAAPRPVSVLLALDESSGAALVAAHRHAVAAAMGYLEERGLIVRTQVAGERYDVAARWEKVVAYTHGVNRHGEPHLHDHVVVGARPAGEDTVLDRRSLVAHATAADALYLATLRQHVNARTVWRAWRSFQGHDHVVGVDEGYRVLWGGHHDGRGDKLSWSREEARATWRRDLARYQREAAPDAPRHAFDSHVYAASFEGALTVARRDVITAWAHASTFGESAARIDGGLDLLVPALADERGVREASITVAQARGLENSISRTLAIDRARDPARQREREGASRVGSRRSR
ncbi:MAG TPA: relaxase domain-containing protein [Acidimicrobiales bacterium]|nr:relaxase domain-containing protein [Acidimicrobiales bacterium]